MKITHLKRRVVWQIQEDAYVRRQVTEESSGDDWPSAAAPAALRSQEAEYRAAEHLADADAYARHADEALSRLAHFHRKTDARRVDTREESQRETCNYININHILFKLHSFYL